MNFPKLNQGTILLIMRVSVLQLVLLTVLATLSYATHTNGQDILERKVTIEVKNKPVYDVLLAIEKQAKVNFTYKHQIIENKKITLYAKNETVADVLHSILDEDIAYNVIDESIILKMKDPNDAGYDRAEAFAISVSGRVIDQDQQPLPGVNIIEKGTSNGTTTDVDGNYTINVRDNNSVLVFSFIAYKSQEIEVGVQNQINVSMIPEIQSLEEVVIVGYGAVKKGDLTGAVGSVSSSQIKELPITSSEQALQGRVAGVQVIQGNAGPGGAVTVRIRGGNSALGGNEPLYVIDGFPLYNGQTSDVSQSQPSNGLASINPNDIVSMEVLKDASATAIYGARGANGVVIITTKRGQAGNGQVDFEAYTGVQVVSNKLDLLNATEYMDLAGERARNMGTTDPFADRSRWTSETDWQDLIYNDAPISNYTLTFSGGNDKNRYAISGNWFDQQGIIQNSGFKRGSIRINLDNQISEKLSLSTSITTSRSVNDQARTAILFSNGIVYSTLIAPPNVPAKNDDGTYFVLGSIPTADPAWNNPLAQAEKAKNRTEGNRVLANTNLTYAFTPALSLSVRLGIDYDNSEYGRYIGKELTDGLPGGKASATRSSGSNYLNENIITYKKKFNGIHDLNITAGYTWQEGVSSSLTAGSENFSVDIFGVDNLGAGSVLVASSSNRTKNTLLSWLGRANYIFKDKYLLTLTARADGSSRFGENNKWGFFPSAALAWRLSEEQFIRNITVISDLKLRASYGLTGNQEIGSYQSLPRLSNVNTVVGNQSLATGYAATTVANADLKWETTAQFDVGLDASFWNDRLSLTVDYYNKNTEDLLAQVPMPLSSGFSNVLLNSGNITNKGFEFSLSARVLGKSALKWDIGGNFSTNENTVEKVAVAGGSFFAPSLTSPISVPVNIIKEGHPLSAHYGYVRDGLWDTDQTTGSLMPTAKAGDQRYKDLNGDNAITEADRTILGNPAPDVIYGFNSNVTFGNFDFSFLIQGVSGNTVFNANKFSMGDNFARGGNQLAETLDRWTPENQNVNALYPRISTVSPLVSDRLFEDGSYLRLRNVMIGYNVPVSKLGLKGFRTARIYASAQNLFTITDYTGYDPEVSSTGSSDLRKGIDVGAYPFAKSYLVGLKFGF